MSRYDATRDHVLALLRLGHLGEPGVAAAVATLENSYVDAVASDRGGAHIARSEFSRMIANAGPLLADPIPSGTSADNRTLYELAGLPAPANSPPAVAAPPVRPHEPAQADPQDHSGDTGEPTTWEPIDLGPWLAGDVKTPQPTVGISRIDGQKLVYAGREHTVFGETEAGKSWFCLECAAVEIRMGRDVVYIHYEEGDPASTIERLLLLGVTPEQVRRHLRFVAPARPVHGPWLEPLLDPPPALVIHDGVNEAMSLHGADTNQIDGAATFRRTITKPFLAVGAASLSADHVVKNSDNRGRYAIGSAHKVNAIDGAAFLMVNIAPFGRGMRGASSVYVTKDRPGQLRAHGKPTGQPGMTLIGVLTVDATGDTADFLTFFPPKDKDDQGQQGEPLDPDAELADEVDRLVAEQPDQTVDSWRRMRALLKNAGVAVRDEKLREILERLVLAGRLVMVPGKSNAKGYRTPESASRAPRISECPETVSASASPIGEDAGTHTDGSASDAPGRAGTQVCSDCGNGLLASQSQAAGQCEACRRKSSGVNE